ncbi:MAG: HAD family hydrolase [Candidatus Hydrogenedentota bacterium]
MHSSKPRPQAVTFDFWLTLFQDASGSVRQEMRIEAFRKALGTPEDETRHAFEQWPRIFYEVHIGEQRTLTPRDAVDIACRELDIAIDEAIAVRLANEFAEAILEHPPTLLEGAEEAVRKAAERFPVGLISDTAISPGRVLRPLIERNGLAGCFQVLTFSDEVGVAKPQRAMFERTAEALGVPMASLLHLGDLEPTDIAGVQAVGGRGALFIGANDRFRDDTRADYVVENWGDFLVRFSDMV